MPESYIQVVGHFTTTEQFLGSRCTYNSQRTRRQRLRIGTRKHKRVNAQNLFLTDNLVFYCLAYYTERRAPWSHPFRIQNPISSITTRGEERKKIRRKNQIISRPSSTNTGRCSQSARPGIQEAETLLLPRYRCSPL